MLICFFIHRTRRNKLCNFLLGNVKCVVNKWNTERISQLYQYSYAITLVLSTRLFAESNWLIGKNELSLIRWYTRLYEQIFGQLVNICTEKIYLFVRCVSKACNNAVVILRDKSVIFQDFDFLCYVATNNVVKVKLQPFWLVEIENRLLWRIIGDSFWPTNWRHEQWTIVLLFVSLINDS